MKIPRHDTAFFQQIFDELKPLDRETAMSRAMAVLCTVISTRYKPQEWQAAGTIIKDSIDAGILASASVVKSIKIAQEHQK